MPSAAAVKRNEEVHQRPPEQPHQYRDGDEDPDDNKKRCGRSPGHAEERSRRRLNQP
jgi:hypothetical protein